MDFSLELHYSKLEDWVNDRRDVFSKRNAQAYSALIAGAQQLTNSAKEVPALKKRIASCRTAAGEAEAAITADVQNVVLLKKRRRETLERYGLWTELQEQRTGREDEAATSQGDGALDCAGLFDDGARMIDVAIQRRVEQVIAAMEQQLRRACVGDSEGKEKGDEQEAEDCGVVLRVFALYDALLMHHSSSSPSATTGGNSEHDDISSISDNSNNKHTAKSSVANCSFTQQHFPLLHAVIVTAQQQRQDKREQCTDEFEIDEQGNVIATHSERQGSGTATSATPLHALLREESYRMRLVGEIEALRDFIDEMKFQSAANRATTAPLHAAPNRDTTTTTTTTTKKATSAAGCIGVASALCTSDATLQGYAQALNSLQHDVLEEETMTELLRMHYSNTSALFRDALLEELGRANHAETKALAERFNRREAADAAREEALCLEGRLGELVDATRASMRSCQTALKAVYPATEISIVGVVSLV